MRMWLRGCACVNDMHTHTYDNRHLAGIYIFVLASYLKAALSFTAPSENCLVESIEAVCFRKL
jgi:hypothetical protein